MKKILICLIAIFLIAGCGQKEDAKNYDQEYQTMKEKLIEYGKLVYENYQWLNDETKNGTYPMTVKELGERNGYDISMFVNPETKKKCNLDKTRIEFIFNGKKADGTYDYKFNPVLDCE
jgi:hypothetical protein